MPLLGAVRNEGFDPGSEAAGIAGLNQDHPFAAEPADQGLAAG